MAPHDVTQPRTPDYSLGSESNAKKLIDRCIADARNNAARLSRDRADWHALLFYRGGADNHWSVWDESTNRYVPRGSDPAQGGIPDWMPRPVTNKFATKIDGIAAILDQSMPAQQWAPATDDDADKAAAEVIKDAVPVILEEMGWTRLRPQQNKLATLIDKTALVISYDTDPQWGMGEIQLLRCGSEDCEAGLIDPAVAEDEGGGNCPECGEPLGDAIDERAMPMMRQEPNGRMKADLVPSFELSLPSNTRSPDARENPWVLLHTRFTPEEVQRQWPQAAKNLNLEGQKTRASDSKGGGVNRQFADAMLRLSSPLQTKAPGGVTPGAGAGSSEQTGPVVYRCFHDPIEDEEFYFPEGLYGVVIDDQAIEAGPLPYKDDDGRPFKNVVIRGFASTHGNQFCKPPSDDLIPVQIAYNTTDALIQAIIMHDAAPITFIPLSVSLVDEPSGTPGEIVRFRSTVPGEKPERERGVGVPPSVYQYLDQLDARFEEISRLNSVLGGQRPEGDPTLGEVQILQERGMSAFSSPLEALIENEKEISRIALRVARQSAWNTRFAKIHGEDGQWDVSQFEMASLKGKVDVQVEPQSAWPKSPVMQVLRFEKAVAIGVLPPPAMDPELQTKALALFDLADMKKSLDVDRKQIARELDRWKAAHLPQEIMPPNPATQNLQIHLYLKQQFIRTEEAELLQAHNPMLHQAMVMHIQTLQMMLMPPAPVEEDTRSDKEKGESTAVDDAVGAGAIAPAGGQPDPMEEALASGAIAPGTNGAPAGGQPPGPSIDDLMAADVLAPTRGADGNGASPSSG